MSKPAEIPACAGMTNWGCGDDGITGVFCIMRFMSDIDGHIDEPPRPGKLRELASKLLFAAVGYHFVYAYVVNAAINKWGMPIADNVGVGRLLWLIGFGGTVGFVALYWSLNMLVILLYFFRSSLRGGFAEGAAMGALVSVVWFIGDWITWANQGNSLTDINFHRYMLLVLINAIVGGVCGSLVGMIASAGRVRGEAVARVIVFAFIMFQIAVISMFLVFKIFASLYGEDWGYIGSLLCVMATYFAAGVVYFRAPNEQGGVWGGFKLGLLFAVFAAVCFNISQFDNENIKLPFLLAVVAGTTLAGKVMKK